MKPAEYTTLGVVLIGYLVAGVISLLQIWRRQSLHEERHSVMQERVDRLEKGITTSLDKIDTNAKTELAKVEVRIQQIEVKLDNQNGKIGDIAAMLSGVKATVDSLHNIYTKGN